MQYRAVYSEICSGFPDKTYHFLFNAETWEDPTEVARAKIALGNERLAQQGNEWRRVLVRVEKVS